MSAIPELNLTDELVMSLRRHLRVPPGHTLLNGETEPKSNSVSIIEPYEHTYRFRPKASEIGHSVYEIFAQRFPFRATTEWGKKQNAGHLGVNDTITPLEYLVQSSDTLFHRNIGVFEPTVPDEIEIIEQNKDFLWIDKPAPLPMHSGGRYHRNTVVSLLENKGYGPLFIVHRLDAVTSGLILLAKSETSAAMAAKLISEGQTHKHYEAIVRGNPPSGNHEIFVGIKRDKGFLFKCSDDTDAKPAQTLFTVLHQGDGWAHVKCVPVTGRTHQIRLHLAHWGYPIWDDAMYNGTITGTQRSKLRQDRAISLVSFGMQTQR
jgi:RluA family pseudouridine synthase